MPAPPQKKIFLNEWLLCIPTLVASLKIYNKMFFVSLSDTVELYVVTLTDKPWTSAKEVIIGSKPFSRRM